MAQKYQVLARKYRPQAFRDVVGQEAAVTTLKNAIRFNKVAHAYLFCGSRGVGKTTLARLFAKALNCQSPTADWEPCNQCPSCQEISSGQSLDVIEIDGASNRGIDDIRQINETIGYAPSHGKYKIYIIDEVHMLTKEAFNALLKTLEEPPEKAKFFFATTESHKVLPTIISRCQRFDLARIQTPLIVSKLDQIARDLSRQVEPEALQLIAHFSEGSLRDAESLFDQILCFAEHTVTASLVRQSLGLVPAELFANLDEAFSTCNLAYAFELVAQLFQTGKDLAHFLEQLIEHYRNLTLAKLSGAPTKAYTQQQLLHILDLLIQAEATFQKSPFQRIALESILLQIIRSRHRIPTEVLVRHLITNAEGKTQNAERVGETPAPPREIAEGRTQKAERVGETPAPPREIAERRTQNAERVEDTPPPPQEVPIPTPPAAISEPPPTLSLKPVPFNPFKEIPLPQESAPIPSGAGGEAPSSSAFCVLPSAIPPGRHASYYDTLIRFTAVELEGIVKN